MVRPPMLGWAYYALMPVLVLASFITWRGLLASTAFWDCHKGQIVADVGHQHRPTGAQKTGSDSETHNGKAKSQATAVAHLEEAMQERRLRRLVESMPSFIAETARDTRQWRDLLPRPPKSSENRAQELGNPENAGYDATIGRSRMLEHGQTSFGWTRIVPWRGHEGWCVKIEDGFFRILVRGSVINVKA